jgi:hypothetical protein
VNLTIRKESNRRVVVARQHGIGCIATAVIITKLKLLLLSTITKFLKKLRNSTKLLSKSLKNLVDY